jgi:hypothetical protein
LGTDLLVRPFHIWCFAEMRFTGALAYEPPRADAIALAVALDCDPTPRLW